MAPVEPLAPLSWFKNVAFGCLHKGRAAHQLGAKLAVFVDDDPEKLMEIHEAYPRALLIWLKGFSRKKFRNEAPYRKELDDRTMVIASSYEQVLAEVRGALAHSLDPTPSQTGDMRRSGPS